MVGIGASGHESSSSNWTKVMDLLTDQQRKIQAQLFERILGPGGYMSQVEGWKPQQLPTREIGPQEAGAFQRQLGGFTGLKNRLGGILAEKGPSDQTLATLDNISNPVMREANILSSQLKRQGGGMGQYSARTSSDVVRGETDIASQALGQLGQLRGNILMQDQYQRQGRQDQAANQLPQILAAITEMHRTRGTEQLQDRRMQVQYEDNLRDKQMAMIMQMIGIPAGLSTAVGQGLGAFGESESSGGGANASVCHAAAQYFGWFTPEWFYARDWILNKWSSREGLIFRNFYKTNSKVLSLVIRNSKVAKEEWRPFFEWAAEKGRVSAPSEDK
jgi:hypothetical protein